MASIKQCTDKAGNAFYKVTASCGRGRRVTRSWHPEAGWSRKTIERECAISTIADATGAEVDTNGKRCPFSPSAHCGDCALYASGCALARIAAACKK